MMWVGGSVNSPNRRKTLRIPSPLDSEAMDHPLNCQKLKKREATGGNRPLVQFSWAWLWSTFLVWAHDLQGMNSSCPWLTVQSEIPNSSNCRTTNKNHQTTPWAQMICNPSQKSPRKLRIELMTRQPHPTGNYVHTVACVPMAPQDLTGKDQVMILE
jgi:hypothetical protein